MFNFINKDIVAQSWWDILQQLQLSNDSFLELPTRLQDVRRPRTEIQTIYVRGSYARIFDMIHRDIAEGVKQFVVTGTPGTGKSTFMYYFMWRMLKDVDANFGAKGRFNFYIQKTPRTVLQFKGSEVIRLKGNEAEDTLEDDRKALVIVDMAETAEPMISVGICIVLSSPNRARFKEFSKAITSKFCMNPWDYNELIVVWEKMYSQVLSIKDVNKAYNLCGGIPRYVLEQNKEAGSVMNAAFDAIKNGISSLSQFIDSNQANDDKITYKILHLVSQDDTLSNAKLAIASSYVTERLFENLKKEEMDTAITFMNNNQLSYTKSATGGIFELMAHKRIYEHGISDFRRCPERKVNKTEMSANYSSYKLRPLRFEPLPPFIFGNLSYLNVSNADKFGRYYQPEVGNFKSIDSFTIRNNEVFLFQITVAKKHSVLASGLEAIVDFVETKWPEDKGRFTYHLVFVFPASEKNSKTFGSQPILGEDKKVLDNVPDKLKPFLANQWIAELEILNSVGKKFSEKNKNDV